MANLTVGELITVFRCDEPDTDIDHGSADSVEHLWTRERAERAAAKRSASLAARRIHQELASLYAKQRRAGGHPNHG